MKLTKSQSIALDSYLCSYPDNMSYDDIIGLLETETFHDDLATAEFFEDWFSPRLAEEIESLKYCIDREYSELLAELELKLSWMIDCAPQKTTGYEAELNELKRVIAKAKG